MFATHQTVRGQQECDFSILGRIRTCTHTHTQTYIHTLNTYIHTHIQGGADRLHAVTPRSIMTIDCYLLATPTHTHTHKRTHTHKHTHTNTYREGLHRLHAARTHLIMTIYLTDAPTAVGLRGGGGGGGGRRGGDVPARHGLTATNNLTIINTDLLNKLACSY